jgi:predicted metalloprotease with PDZ domain
LRRVILVIALSNFGLPILAARPAAATIRYHISLAHPEQHQFRVTMWIPNVTSDTVVALPAWNALYQIRDFSVRVRDVRGLMYIKSANWILTANQLDKQTWRFTLPDVNFPAGEKQMNVSYSIEWNDAGPFDSQLNSQHAFMNFAEVLMYVPDRRGEDTTVSFADIPAGWRAAAELSPGEGPNSFAAASYDALVDAPVEIGKFEEFEFDNNGAHFRVVVDGKSWDKGRLDNDLRRITGYELKLMGGAPFREYTFFFHIGPYAEIGGGGMEHANCTAIAASSVGAAASSAAHEFFHLWNVKRIRPQSLEPVDYTKEQYTRALWFAEGVTNTYGAYTLERTGLNSKEQFYTGLAAQISELQSRPARAWESVEDSSLDAWLEKYNEYSRPDRSISYYDKGEILGVFLDLSIRDATENHKSLDDVLRRMNEEYAKAGKFYNDSESIRSVVEEVSGRSFQEFFRRYVAGTDEISYNDFLGTAGLMLKIDADQTADLGFWPGRGSGGSIIVAQVETGGVAEGAGLRAGDVILGMNGEPFPRKFSTWMREHSPGETVQFHVRRDGQAMDIAFPLGSREDRRYSIVEVAHPSDKQRRIRDGLLHGATD